MRSTVPQLLTASYGRWRSIDGLLVRTSLGRPRWFPNEGYDLPALRSLMPEGWMLRSDNWALEYEAMLERHGPEPIAEALAALAERHDTDLLVLGCFEGSPAECHRGVFARWWQETTGQTVVDLSEMTR